MASYVPSNLATAQAKLLGAFQSGELRYRIPATYLEFVRNSNIMFPNYATLRTREDRTVTAYYKLRASRALGTGRTHNHTGNRGDSGSLTPSWTTYKDPFSISLKQANNNVFTMDEMFNNDIQNAIVNHVEGHESTAANYLFANRTGVNAAVADGSFNSTQDVFEISVTDEKRAIQIAQSVMDVNKWGGMMTIFCDTLAYNKFKFYAAQGISNNENLSFQFAGINFVHSVDLYALFAALGTPYTAGSWIIAPEGTYGVLPHIPKENQLGVDTKIQTYGSILNPIDGQNYALHSYPTAADGTALGGYTQDEVLQYEVSIDLAFTSAPLSVSTETPLYAFAIV